MIYSNTSFGAITALENQRLGDDDYDNIEKECPSCGAINPETFVRHNASREIVGCDQCLKVIDWEVA